MREKKWQPHRLNKITFTWLNSAVFCGIFFSFSHLIIFNCWKTAIETSFGLKTNHVTAQITFSHQDSLNLAFKSHKMLFDFTEEM